MTTLDDRRTSHVGVHLRTWRERRRLSQLELANRADISARHVSFLETGRSNPTRAMLLRLSEHLDIPLRERNSLLLAGGFAPAFPEHRLSDVPMASVADAIGKILTAHSPYPAVAIDRHWNMVDANDAVAILTEGCAAVLLEPPVNVLRLSLHPNGMAPRILDLALWRGHVLHRLRHQIAVTGDDRLRDLFGELDGYPGGTVDSADLPGSLVVPLRVRHRDTELAFLSTTTMFGTPLDVTVAELAIESFFPADAVTAATLRSSVSSD
ncbi:helix-turn-helix domain-containing protein [Rhodococcus jostii]|uniref:Transcriptional regulator, contains XRE-family HTH domain n=1 Tax=Rhodococcus jostii TaxID=132919 RepID=A0A1H4REX9_RHOJO|nr:helix-turn-helix transcriptional regulator [Rhodococcus jostii]SEC30423.1 Transcriptional regulator, contains XRE-family HTH domain [Rhodococcus jostii]